jgi:hypothetical protein
VLIVSVYWLYCVLPRCYGLVCCVFVVLLCHVGCVVNKGILLCYGGRMWEVLCWEDVVMCCCVILLLFATVLRRCQYRSSSGVMYDVRSGEKFIDPRNCSLCLCRDGVPTLCQRLRETSCDRLNPRIINRNCTVRGRILPSGASVAVS